MIRIRHPFRVKAIEPCQERWLATLDATRAALAQVTARCERLTKECEAWRACDDADNDDSRTDAWHEARRLRAENEEAERHE